MPRINRTDCTTTFTNRVSKLRLFGLGLLCLTAAACSDPHSQPLPDDLAQAASDAKFQAALQKLPPDERALVTSYIETVAGNDALAKKGIVKQSPHAKTIREAIETQKKWNADAKTDKEKAEKLAKAYESLPKAEVAFGFVPTNAEIRWRSIGN